jgi:hypothetical protein
VGATVTVAVSAAVDLGEADGLAMADGLAAEGQSVTATQPPAQASTPVAKSAAFITGTR